MELAGTRLELTGTGLELVGTGVELGWNWGGTGVELAGTRLELTGTGVELVGTGDGSLHSLHIMLQVQEDWKNNQNAYIAPIAMELKPRMLSWREKFGALRDSLQNGELMEELKEQKSEASFDATKVVLQ